MTLHFRSDGRRLDDRTVSRRRSAFLFAVAVALTGNAWSDDEGDLDEEDAEFVSKAMRVDQKSPLPAAVLSEAPKPAEAPQESLRWAMPPLPYRGALTFGHDRYRTSEGSSFASTLGLSVSGRSYIYAPWLATLSGGAGASQSRGSDGTEGRSVSGNLSSSLVPRSRFPGTLSIGAGSSTSSTRNSQTTTEYQSLQWAQAYAPLDRSFQSNWTYNHNRFGVGSSPMSRTDALSGVLSLKPGGELPQTLSLSAALTRASSGTGDGSGSANLAASHSVYFEDYVLSVGSDASVNQARVRGTQGSEYEFAQAGSQFDWIPSDDYPLRLRGSLRHQEVRTAQAGVAAADRRLATTMLALNADYPASRNWALSGTANVLRTANEDSFGTTGSTLASATGSLSWSGDGRAAKFDEWDYRVLYGGSGSLATTRATGAGGSSGTSSLNGSANVSQSLTRSFGGAGRQRSDNLLLSQGYSVNGGVTKGAAGQPVTHSLSHSASYGWAPIPERPTLAASLSATDSRGFGGNTYQFQSIQGAASESLTLSAYESASWSLSLPLTRQGSDQGGRWQGSVTAGASYGHGRFAGVSGLRYAAGYTILIRENLVARQTVPYTGQERVGYDLEHRVTHSLAWRLGLLSWQLSNDISKVPEAGASAAIRLTVTREFGGVL